MRQLELRAVCGFYFRCNQFYGPVQRAMTHHTVKFGRRSIKGRGNGGFERRFPWAFPLRLFGPQHGEQDSP